MKGYFLGPMPIGSFLKEFMPCTKQTPYSPAHFSSLPAAVKLEAELYKPLRRCLESPTLDDKNIFPGLEMVDTSNHADANAMPGRQEKIDGLIYRRDNSRTPKDNPTDFSKAISGVEVKPRDIYDPFEKAPPDSFSSDVLTTSENPSGSTNPALSTPFELSAQRHVETRGQLISYAVEIMARQHRTHVFTLFIFHPFARLIRWDRSGAIVSERFNYREDSQPLVEYFWRLAHMGSEDLGLDPTVQLASPAEAEKAHEVLAEWKPPVTRPVVKFQVPIEGGAFETFLGWGPVFEAHSLTGRATRAFPVYDMKRDKVAFLKDMWRSPAMTPEVDTLKKLLAANCRHVPTYVCGGDLPDQLTKTPDFVNYDWNLNGTEDPITRRVHCRFVVKEVGKPLQVIRSSRALLRVTLDALLGHHDAVVKCNILHRDISAGNILIVEEGDQQRGLLIDWDLSKDISQIKAVPARLADRTGTWQFMSVRLLLFPYKMHELHDDLESFVYVVVFIALRCLGHSADQNACQLIHSIFDYVQPTGAAIPTGGGPKKDLICDGFIATDFSFDCPLWEGWLLRVVEIFQPFHNECRRLELANRAAKVKKQPQVNQLNSLEHLAIRNHDALVALFEETILEPDWPIDERVVDRFASKPHHLASNSKIRSGHIESLRKQRLHGISTPSNPLQSSTSNHNSMMGAPPTKRQRGETSDTPKGGASLSPKHILRRVGTSFISRMKRKSRKTSVALPPSATSGSGPSTSTSRRRSGASSASPARSARSSGDFKLGNRKRKESC
ncbi:hypothetical protein HGRIS_005122 [Hohenbuehelia grisea]|uniref:Protein kinase domain-containing protein n=1 Tax=Hohenbuehelia grisea TaxID=104357 RepID=A0ABR3JEI3_9AGAR